MIVVVSCRRPSGAVKHTRGGRRGHMDKENIHRDFQPTTNGHGMDLGKRVRFSLDLLCGVVTSAKTFVKATGFLCMAIVFAGSQQLPVTSVASFYSQYGVHQPKLQRTASPIYSRCAADLIHNTVYSAGVRPA